MAAPLDVELLALHGLLEQDGGETSYLLESHSVVATSSRAVEVIDIQTHNRSDATTGEFNDRGHA